MLDLMENASVARSQSVRSFGYADRRAGFLRRPLDSLELGLSRVGIDVASLSDTQMGLIRVHVEEHGDVTVLDLIVLLGQARSEECARSHLLLGENQAET